MTTTRDHERRERSPGARAHSIVRIAWITAAVILALFALGAGFARVTASPALCSSCHEMRPQVEAWKTSAHAQIGCAACHETPRPWYEFPVSMAWRAKVLTRDVSAHLSRLGETTGTISIETTTTIPDSICLRCHEPGRAATGREVLIDHTEHAERNGACVSCHLWIAHPDPGADQALLFMGRCFACHGRADIVEASGECGLCHPPSFKLTPESHTPASQWETIDHGTSALADRSLCLMCHDVSLCDDCHGLEMPHPAGWSEGATSHGLVSKKNDTVCMTCHRQGFNFCSMCHHEGYEPAKGPWIAQHPPTARERGTSFCMRCHGPLFCVDCHIAKLSDPVLPVE